jgi:hypothetical protein
METRTLKGGALADEAVPARAKTENGLETTGFGMRTCASILKLLSVCQRPNNTL